MYIPDPIELMDMRIEREIDKIDLDGKYQCSYCSTMIELDDVICLSPMGDGPGICGECFEKNFDQNAKHNK